MKSYLLYIFLAVASAGYSQMKVRAGDFKNLKAITRYNVTFDYSNMQIQGFDSEEAFLEDKMKKREHKEGVAENFRETWYTDRSTKYEPKFIEYFNKRFENGALSVGRDSTARYTMHVKTTWLYPGY
ncbi:MAG TPA: hypothetical protein VFQ50_02685, partial [Flavobacterium sp.]|nr:hypothetical protein [Flavobacterium sp.]